MPVLVPAWCGRTFAAVFTRVRKRRTQISPQPSQPKVLELRIGRRNRARYGEYIDNGIPEAARIQCQPLLITWITLDAFQPPWKTSFSTFWIRRCCGCFHFEPFGSPPALGFPGFFSLPLRFAAIAPDALRRRLSSAAGGHRRVPLQWIDAEANNFETPTFVFAQLHGERG